MFKMKLLSDSMMTLGTWSTADLFVATHSSPLC